MNRSFAARISKLEPPEPQPLRMPHVLEIRHDETKADAIARLEQRYGQLPRDHMFLTVPAKPRTAEERAECSRRTEARQLALIADAKSAPRKEEKWL